MSIHFGAITKDRPFPRTSLHTIGLSGTDDRTQTSWRAVVGGCGEYDGARGEVGERLIATNTSTFPDGTGPAGCWRNEFDLWVLGEP